MIRSGKDAAAPGDDWQAAWQPVIDQVGTDLGGGAIGLGADRIEAGLIRRYLEPLEFDCPLHYDAEVARGHGFADVTVPYTGSFAFTASPLWSPGRTVFTSAERNAQPQAKAGRPKMPEGTPPVSGYFATEIDMEFVRPAVAGERLARRGYRLLSCMPKETKIGRGAFLRFESEIIDEAGEVVTRIRSGLYLYNPHRPEPS